MPIPPELVREPHLLSRRLLPLAGLLLRTLLPLQLPQAVDVDELFGRAEWAYVGWGWWEMCSHAK